MNSILFLSFLCFFNFSISQKWYPFPNITSGVVGTNARSDTIYSIVDSSHGILFGGSFSGIGKFSETKQRKKFDNFNFFDVDFSWKFNEQYWYL